VDSIEPDDWTVLELSSFQLRDLDRIKASPNVAVVTNFTPNHLDWHGTLEDYRHSKQTILRWQTPDDVTVLNADDADVSTWPTNARCLGFGERDCGAAGIHAIAGSARDWRVRINGLDEVIPLGQWLQVPGRHNQHNAAAAIVAALSIGANLSDAQAALESFAGLPHRLQFIVETAGRRFYNDSIATTPESVIKALDAIDRPIILLAGGYDKGIDLRDMADRMAEKVKAAALLGTTAPILKDHLNRVGFADAQARICGSLEDAVNWCGEQSQPGDVILLSPGCASYDWFRNFVDRGEQFTRWAMSWTPNLDEPSAMNRR
jgi:UDP-N-acetylmuramoylalanine--D-glutamate ligase